MRQYFIKVSIILTVLILNLPASCHSFPLKIQDARGKEISLFSAPKRIISLSPAITETLFALGLDKEITGVTTFCDYPPKAKKKAKTGSYTRPNIEKIVALKPELVLCATHNSLTIEKLEELGISVFAVNPQTIEQSLDCITSVGRVTGKLSEAARIVNKLNRRIKALSSRLNNLKEEDKPTVFWQIGSHPLVSVGPRTFSHDLILSAGGRNIAGDALIEYPRYSLEAVLARNPEVIIVVGMTKNDYSKTEVEHWKKWGNLSAVKNRRVHQVDLNIVTRQGSPRAIEGLEKIAHILHPELFKPR